MVVLAAVQTRTAVQALQAVTEVLADCMVAVAVHQAHPLFPALAAAAPKVLSFLSTFPTQFLPHSQAFLPQAK